MIEQNAFVLHTRPYKENQQLVDLLTENDGKVSATVYVGQSKRSIKKGVLQPFLPVRLMLKSYGSFQSIKNIDAIGKSFSLTKNRLFSAFYINELAIRLLTEQIPCHGLFRKYKTTLVALANGQAIAPQLRSFEQVLLAELGLSFDFTPIFEHDVNYFYYISEQGFVPVYEASPKSAIQYFDKQHLQVIAELEIDNHSSITREAAMTYKLLMRQIINQLLGNKPLNSRKLFINKI
jgi:DNA repair protein RecO (recombination protein O)